MLKFIIMNTQAIDEYTKVFSALGHPVRLKIVCGLLKNGRCNVNTMTRRLNVSQALVSQHVKILKEAGIISGTREGNIIWYSICSEIARKILASLADKICED